MISHPLARWSVALLAAALIGVSLLQLEATTVGVAVTRTRVGSIPVTAFAPAAGVAAAKRPVVVIAHGFAGSQQLMLPFALTLAHHGYIALTFDFPGHGRNVVPMAGGIVDFAASTRALLDALGEVAVAARRWPGGDGRLALLGHSMASDIVIRRGMADDAVRATVALSAYSPTVTASAPRNLLIVDGALEPRMLHDEGLRIAGLALDGAPAVAGRTYGDFAAGSARRFALADGVEHISVLYSRTAQREALDWIDRSFGVPVTVTGARAVDGRGPWLGLLCLGLVALAWPLASLLPRAVRPQPRAVATAEPVFAPAIEAPAASPVRTAAPARRAVLAASREDEELLELPSMSAVEVVAAAPVRARGTPLGDNPWRSPGVPAPDLRQLGWRGFWPVALLPAILTPLLLWKVPGGFLPILLGDYLVLHFALYGVLTAAGLWFARVPRSPFAGLRPLALLFAAVVTAVYGVFALGLPLDRYVTSFAPSGVRGSLVAAMFCGALPYFLADEWLARGASRARGAYAFTKFAFLLSLAIAIALKPGRLFFLAIVVPLILVAFVIYGLFSRWIFRSIGHPWAGALANAFVFAWLIAVTFPVVSEPR